ncbi:MAG: hypothetical protein ACHQO8_08710, partial [Vicinamibacterales bacterium]
NVTLVVAWNRLAEEDAVAGGTWLVAREAWLAAVCSWLVAAVAGVMVFVACRAWLHEILIFPNDPQRADMLVVIQLGIRRMLQAKNPYTMYQVPWDATMPYGPLMWGPYIAPYLLHADLRFLTIAGELFVPVACAIAAVAGAANGRVAPVAAWLVVLSAIAMSPDLRGFASVGHTPSYWPLLALFAWLAVRERWYAAAVALGLLIVARSTMVSVAPVLVMAVWLRDRRRVGGAIALVAAATVLPYLPFAVWDWRALTYALYGSYVSLMKGFVWTSTDWVQHTIGVSGLLLRAHWQRAVEPVQGVVLLLVYVLGWRALRAGRQPLPWMALALLAFSLTTLWPVGYVYLDVFLLLVCGALGESAWLRGRGVASAWIATLAVTVFVLIATSLSGMSRGPTLDVGTGAVRPFLYAGFADDEGGPDRTFAWVENGHAEVLVPRRSRADAEIEVVCEPHLPTRASTQEMSAVLNGVLLATVPMREGWQTVSLPAPARAWQFGINELHLSFSNAVSPREAGVGDDARRLSAAIDRLTVRTR